MSSNDNYEDAKRYQEIYERHYQNLARDATAWSSGLDMQARQAANREFNSTPTHASAFDPSNLPVLTNPTSSTVPEETAGQVAEFFDKWSIKPSESWDWDARHGLERAAIRFGAETIQQLTEQQKYLLALTRDQEINETIINLSQKELSALQLGQSIRVLIVSNDVRVVTLRWQPDKGGST